MTVQRVIALANRFKIKLAISYDDKTNPGGEDSGSPEFINKETPLSTAPKKIDDPRVDYQKELWSTPKSEPSTPGLSDPGEIVPEERDFYHKMRRYFRSTGNAILYDHSTMRLLGLIRKHPKNDMQIKIMETIKDFSTIGKKIEEFGLDTTKQPTMTAKLFLEYVTENKKMIINTGRDIRNYFTKLGILNPIGIPTLLLAYRLLYNDPEIRQIYSSIYSSFMDPNDEELKKTFPPDPRISIASRRRIRNLILNGLQSFSG